MLYSSHLEGQAQSAMFSRYERYHAKALPTWKSAVIAKKLATMYVTEVPGVS